MTLEKNLTELFNRGGRIEFGMHDGQRAVVVTRPDLRAKVSILLAKQSGDVDAADVASAAEDACRLAYGAGWPGAQRGRRGAAAASEATASGPGAVSGTPEPGAE